MDVYRFYHLLAGRSSGPGHSPTCLCVALLCCFVIFMTTFHCSWVQQEGICCTGALRICRKGGEKVGKRQEPNWLWSSGKQEFSHSRSGLGRTHRSWDKYTPAICFSLMSLIQKISGERGSVWTCVLPHCPGGIEKTVQPCGPQPYLHIRVIWRALMNTNAQCPPHINEIRTPGAGSWRAAFCPALCDSKVQPVLRILGSALSMCEVGKRPLQFTSLLRLHKNGGEVSY